MINHFITVLLMPVLIIQGIYVRRSVPRLPEPEGAHKGQTGAGQKLNILILGDSAAAGVGVSEQHNALSGHISALLSSQYHLSWELIAKNGYKLADIIQQLKTVEKNKTHYDIAIISIGVNDAKGFTSENDFDEKLDQLTSLLIDEFSVNHIVFSAIPPMADFPSLPFPLSWLMGLRSTLLNSVLVDHTEKSQHTSLLKNEIAVGPHFFAADGFHPNQQGYGIWAKQIWNHLKSYSLAVDNDSESL